MLTDEGWYDDVDKVCKALKLNLVSSAKCVFPHVKRAIIVILAFLEVLFVRSWILAGFLALIKLYVFSPIEMFTHYCVLAIYSMEHPWEVLLVACAYVPYSVLALCVFSIVNSEWIGPLSVKLTVDL